MANQYTVLVEETTRGTDPASGYLFPPVTGNPEPEPKFEDKTRTEFRGQDTRLGDVNDSRVSTSWSHTLEAWLYPIKDLMVGLKHLVGYAGTRTVVEVTGYKGILYPPAAAPYGAGGALDGKAIGVIANTDKDGTTVAQKFLGGRPTGLTLEFKQNTDVKFSLKLAGGPWVGLPGQTATAGASFTALKPYNSCDLVCFTGSGITRTGTAPNFTDLLPGTMVTFVPDDLTIDIDPGIEDQGALNGLRGPSKTTVKGQVSAKIKYTIDFTDPATGFSSYDEYVSHCGGPLYHSYLFRLIGPDLAGSTTQYHQFLADFPRMKMSIKVLARDSQGKTTKAEFSGESRYDSTAKYPLAFMTIDKVTAY